MSKLLIVPVFCAFCLIAAKSSAQTASRTDSLYHYASYDELLRHYNTTIGQQSGVYNGREFQAYDRSLLGNANFMDTTATINGIVTYGGITYANVPLLYDIYADELLSLLSNKYTLYILNKEMVSTFTLAGHTFVNIVADTIAKNRNPLHSGFYDVMYNGKITLFERRTKSTQATSGGLQFVIQKIFVTKNYYYLKKADRYYEVGSQGELLDVFKDRKKELQQYIKSNKIKFRKNPEQSMVALCNYYDHLTE